MATSARVYAGAPPRALAAARLASRNLRCAPSRPPRGTARKAARRARLRFQGRRPIIRFLAETSSRAARASISSARSRLAAALAVVAVVGVTSTSSLGSPRPRRARSERRPRRRDPRGSATRASAGRAPPPRRHGGGVCNLELFNDYMYKCCELSNDATVQQDCLCHPIDYGFDETMTDNVGTNATDAAPPELGAARRMGNFASASRHGSGEAGKVPEPVATSRGTARGLGGARGRRLVRRVLQELRGLGEQNACLSNR